MRDDFVALILTHGRPNNVTTYKKLRDCGYTGDIVIVIDNEDLAKKKYIEKYGDEVYEFDKLAISKTFDTADNFDDRRTIVYARNASFGIAKELGYRYFIQLDDDYTSFVYTLDHNQEYTKNKKIKQLDNCLESMVTFLNNTPFKSIAMSQGGDFIGGESAGILSKALPRKAMNSFVCDVEKPFKFIGRINEDVNTYTLEASKGLLLCTIPNIRLEQKNTQSNDGGMTDVYLESGTYIKSFYSVMFHPSSVKIKTMGNSNRRLHHSIKWKNTTPNIISEKYKK